jgi:hypothetical protein
MEIRIITKEVKHRWQEEDSYRQYENYYRTLLA